MRSPNPTIDYTSKDYESFRTEMISGLVKRVPEYTDTSQSDAGIAIIETLAERLDVLSYYQDSMANEAFITTCQQRTSAEVWCKILGYVPDTATTSTVMQCFELYTPSATNTTIPKGTLVKTVGDASEAPIIFETMSDLVIPAGAIGTEIREEYNPNYDLGIDGGLSKYKYLVDTQQGYTIPLSYVGTPKGLPNTKFLLPHTHILTDTIKLNVYNGTDYEEWTQVYSFIDSYPESRHFVIEVGEMNSTFVRFGDGKTGYIPIESSNPIYATYRVGGGKVGNVSPNTVIRLDSQSLNAIVKGTFNPSNPLIYGRDAEPLSSIKINAPLHNAVKWGIVTLTDFDHFIALNYADKVLSSKTILDPATSKANIYILPKGSNSFDSLKTDMLPEIQERLIVKGECDLLPAIQKVIDMTISVTIGNLYSRAEIGNKVNYYINDYFFLGSYPLGQELVLSDLCNDMKNSIEGIKSAKFALPLADIINPEDNEVIVVGELNIELFGGTE